MCITSLQRLAVWTPAGTKAYCHAMEALSAPNVQLQATRSTSCKGLARLTALQPVVISTLLVC